MVRNLLLVLVVLVYSSAQGSYNPDNLSSKSSKKSSKRYTLEAVQSKSSHNILTIKGNEQVRNISFVILDSQGIIRMFGDDYSTGSNIHVGHLVRGSYTIFFSKEFGSGTSRFTVS